MSYFDWLENLEVNNRNNIPLLLNLLKLNGVGVEVGVEKGKFSDILLEKSELSKLHSIDLWKNLPQEIYNDINNLTDEQHLVNKKETEELLKKYGQRSVIIQDDSVIASKMFKDNSLDFVYIDANHSYKNCKDDIKAYWPKVKIGGIISGHDYLAEGEYQEGTFGVKRAVDEFVKEKNQKLFIIKESWPSWFCLKYY